MAAINCESVVVADRAGRVIRIDLRPGYRKAVAADGAVVDGEFDGFLPGKREIWHPDSHQIV